MKTLSITAAFALLFCSASFAGVQQTPKTTKTTTVQKAPATQAKTPAAETSTSKTPVKKKTVVKVKPQAAKPVTAPAQKGNAALKPATNHTSNFTREHSSKQLIAGHKKHHKGKKPAAATSK